MACAHSCLLLLTLVAVVLSLDTAAAKPAGSRAVATRGVYPLRRRFTARGCSSFGHSCFGGHGKRADEDFPPAEYRVDQEAELPEVRLPEALPNTYRQAEVLPLLRQWLQLQAYRRLAETSPN